MPTEETETLTEGRWKMLSRAHVIYLYLKQDKSGQTENQWLYIIGMISYIYIYIEI